MQRPLLVALTDADDAPLAVGARRRRDADAADNQTDDGDGDGDDDGANGGGGGSVERARSMSSEASRHVNIDPTLAVFDDESDGDDDGATRDNSNNVGNALWSSSTMSTSTANRVNAVPSSSDGGSVVDSLAASNFLGFCSATLNSLGIDAPLMLGS